MGHWGLFSVGRVVYHGKPLWVDEIAVDHGDIQEKQEELQPLLPGRGVDVVGLPHLIGVVDGLYVVVARDTHWHRQLYFSHSAITFPLSGYCTTSMWRVHFGDETHYFSVSFNCFIFNNRLAIPYWITMGWLGTVFLLWFLCLYSSCTYYIYYYCTNMLTFHLSVPTVGHRMVSDESVGLGSHVIGFPVAWLQFQTQYGQQQAQPCQNSQ